MELSNLKPLAWIVTVMVGIDALNMPFVATTLQLFPEFFQTSLMPIADQFDGAMFLFKIATIMMFGVWIYRAGRNLLRAGYQDLEFSPGSRIWWFAVPIANLFRPFQGMRELWNASHGEEEYTIAPPLVSIWWAFWLASNILTSVNGRFPSVAMMNMAAVADIGLAIVAITLLHRITSAQARMAPSEVAAVFA